MALVITNNSPLGSTPHPRRNCDNLRIVKMCQKGGQPCAVETDINIGINKCNKFCGYGSEGDISGRSGSAIAIEPDRCIMHRWCRAVVNDDDVDAIVGRVLMKSLPKYWCDDGDLVCGVDCRGFR